MAIIDYVKGELVTPEGKKVKKVTEGFTPTDQAVLTSPIATGAGNFYAPGFGSNQTLDYEYYADDPAPSPSPEPSAPAPIAGGQGGGAQGNAQDAKNDDKSGAGAIPDFGSWADAVMTGSGLIGAGGPITSAIGQATGMTDFTDDFNNYSQTNPEGWAAAVDEAKQVYPTDPAAQVAYANKLMGSDPVNQPGGGYQGQNSAGPAPQKPADSVAATDAGFGNFDTAPGGVDNFGKAPGAPVGGINTASGTKGGGNSDNKSNPGNPNAGQHQAGGAGPGAGPGSESSGKPSGGGFGGSGEGAGGQGYRKGGYISDADYGVPTSMRQTFRRPQPSAPASQQQPSGDAGYAMGGAVVKGGPGHSIGGPGKTSSQTPSRTQRFVASRSRPSRATGGFVASAGFAEGGVVPNQGYAAGGEVDRFNPPQEAIASDGITDNQPIQADEGEYVIKRDAAQILGPEILNALNDPMMAKAFSDMFDAALGLDAGMSSEGTSPAPALPPKKPAAPMGASLANDNGMESPMAFRKGGYVGKRC